MATKWLVCGSREYNDRAAVDSALQLLNSTAGPFRDPFIVIHGDCEGRRGKISADHLARDWAIRNGVHHAAVPALWGRYGNRAGPLRNEVMTWLGPDIVIAFPGGNGTESAVRLANQRNIRVWRPYE